MSRVPGVSVIIPTHNRRHSVEDALRSLAAQEYPMERMEVIVVDDGSTDGTGEQDWNRYPFPVRYHRQEQAGATVARNTGARLSEAEVLVFMDDDITAEPAVLGCLAPHVATYDRHIALATLVADLSEPAGIFASHYLRGAVFRERGATDGPSSAAAGSAQGEEWHEVHFTHCMTGLLAIRRSGLLDLGMFQDPTGGWPNWDDVDLGYRAHRQGYRLWRCQRAVATHHDRSTSSLDACGRRLGRAARSAVALFERYPELQEHIRDYADKAPIAIGRDPARLLVRKAVRSAVSGSAGVIVLKQLISWLERSRPDSPMLPHLYRWTLSAYMVRGYRQGLVESAQVRP